MNYDDVDSQKREGAKLLKKGDLFSLVAFMTDKGVDAHVKRDVMASMSSDVQREYELFVRNKVAVGSYSKKGERSIASGKHRSSPPIRPGKPY